jgi:CRP-like cAMP-binding protein
LLAGLEASGVPVIERRYSPGEHPYMRGDPDEGLWFLLEGTLEVYKLYGLFSKATVRLLDGGGLFGEPSLRSEGRHRDSAKAVSACRAAKVLKGPLVRLLSEDASHAPRAAVLLRRMRRGARGGDRAAPRSGGRAQAGAPVGAAGGALR